MKCIRTVGLALAALLALGSNAQADILAHYTFSNTLVSIDTDDNTEASIFDNGAFTNGEGSVSLGFNSNRRRTNVSTGTNNNGFVYSKSAAIANGYVFFFTVTPEDDIEMDIDSIAIEFTRAGTGFESWAVDISADGTNYTQLAAVSNSFDTDLIATGNGDVSGTLTGFNDLTEAFHVRIALWRTNSGGSSGDRNFIDNVIVNGTTVLVPEPASLALLGLGGLCLLGGRCNRAV